MWYNFEMERFMPSNSNNIEDTKPGQSSVEEIVSQADTNLEIDSTKETNKRFIKIPLSDEERIMKRSELAEKLGVTLENASYFKKQGYHTKENPDYVFSEKGPRYYKERTEKSKEYMNSVTDTKINSLESILLDKEAKKEVAQIVEDFRNKNNIATHHLSEEERIGKKFKLSNGEDVLVGDLILLNLFADSNVSRDANGKLQIIDPETKLSRPFVMTDMIKRVKSPFNFTYLHTKNNNEKKNKIYPTSIAYWMRVSPNAIKKGILKKEDFPVRQSNTTNYEMFGAHERKITKTKPSAYLSNKNGSAQYYIGRDKFVGSNEKINHDTVSIILLDNNTAGVVDSVHGKKEILYTFPLISKDEYNIKREVAVDKLNMNNREVSEKNINSQISVGGPEMKDRIKEYSITNYIKQKSNENSAQYADRVSRLSDISYTLGQFREFMAEAGVGAQNFKWEEQLVLADAFTSVNEKAAILDFAQKYGESGLRAFLSVEQGGKPMGNKIIEVGNNLKNSAEKVFAKYGEIVDVANSAEDEVRNLFADKKLPQNTIDKIHDQLLERAKNLLVSCADNKQKEENITEELDRIKKDIVIAGMAFKELYKNGDSVSLEDIEGMSIESSLAKDLSQKDKVEMTKIYELSRPAVTFENAKHIKILLDEFKANLEKESTFIFNIKINDKVMAFATFYNTKPDTLHIGGLSFHPDVKNPAFGVAVMDSIIKDLGKYNIEAEVHSKNQILAMYTKRFGFSITKELPNLDNSGELYYLVEREKDQDKSNQDKVAA